MREILREKGRGENGERLIGNELPEGEMKGEMKRENKEWRGRSQVGLTEGNIFNNQKGMMPSLLNKTFLIHVIYFDFISI